MGDYTGNGSVDSADFISLRNGFGKSCIQPGSGYDVITDIDGSGHTDSNDFIAFRGNFGKSL